MKTTEEHLCDLLRLTGLTDDEIIECREMKNNNQWEITIGWINNIRVEALQEGMKKAAKYLETSTGNLCNDLTIYASKLTKDNL